MPAMAIVKRHLTLRNIDKNTFIMLVAAIYLSSMKLCFFSTLLLHSQDMLVFLNIGANKQA
jgi:hypothetical protein